MRAPLRAMSAFATFLSEENQGGTPAAREHCRRMTVAANQLDRLIQGALHYTKAVLQEIPMEPVDLAGLIGSLIGTKKTFERRGSNFGCGR